MSPRVPMKTFFFKRMKHEDQRAVSVRAVKLLWSPTTTKGRAEVFYKRLLKKRRYVDAIPQNANYSLAATIRKQDWKSQRRIEMK